MLWSITPLSVPSKDWFSWEIDLELPGKGRQKTCLTVALCSLIELRAEERGRLVGEGEALEKGVGLGSGLGGGLTGFRGVLIIIAGGVAAVFTLKKVLSIYGGVGDIYLNGFVLSEAGPVVDKQRGRPFISRIGKERLANVFPHFHPLLIYILSEANCDSHLLRYMSLSAFTRVEERYKHKLLLISATSDLVAISISL